MVEARVEQNLEDTLERDTKPENNDETLLKKVNQTTCGIIGSCVTQAPQECPCFLIRREWCNEIDLRHQVHNRYQHGDLRWDRADLANSDSMRRLKAAGVMVEGLFTVTVSSSRRRQMKHVAGGG